MHDYMGLQKSTKLLLQALDSLGKCGSQNQYKLKSQISRLTVCECLQAGQNPSRAAFCIAEVYRELKSHLEDRNFEEHHQLRSLGSEPCIWTGQCFADAASVVLQDNLSLQPALHSVARNLAESFRSLLLLLGVRLENVYTTCFLRSTLP